MRFQIARGNHYVGFLHLNAFFKICVTLWLWVRSFAKDDSLASCRSATASIGLTAAQDCRVEIATRRRKS